METYSPVEAEQQMEDSKSEKQQHAPNISELKPVTREAYGGGMYATDEKTEKEISKGYTHVRASKTPSADQPEELGAELKHKHIRASKTQSADGPEEPAAEPKHKPPPSTGDKDLDITGLSYIQ